MRTLPILLLLVLSLPAALAQRLQQLPNAAFTQWTGPEPVGWQTNNVYDDKGKLLRSLVEPVGTAGARLVVKRVVHREETPAIVVFEGGALNSPLRPFMPPADTPVRLLVRYQFVSDSADVLMAAVSLESRNTETGTPKPDKTCDCELKNPPGSGPITLPAAATSQTVAFDAVFPNATSPGTVPPGCMMYVWKIRFWIENKSSHPHEGTTALIEQVQL